MFLLTSLLSVRWVFKAVLTAAGVVYSWRVDRGVSAELRNNSNLILQVSVSHVWWTLARYKQTHLHWSVRPVSWQQFTKQLQVSSAAVCCGGCKQAVGWYVGCCWWVWAWVIFQAPQHTCENVLMDKMSLTPSNRFYLTYSCCYLSGWHLQTHISGTLVSDRRKTLVEVLLHAWMDRFWRTFSSWGGSLRAFVSFFWPCLLLSSCLWLVYLWQHFLSVLTSCGKIIGCVLTPGC